MDNRINSPVPVSVISGFLGSGKTTLLNNLLNNREGSEIAVVVNDFGEINIDSELISEIRSETDNTIDLKNGCICCTLGTSLLESLLDLLNREKPPGHIVIESSGVSDPLGIALNILQPAMRNLLHLENIITVVDSYHISSLKSSPGSHALALYLKMTFMPGAFRKCSDG